MVSKLSPLCQKRYPNIPSRETLSRHLDVNKLPANFFKKPKQVQSATEPPVASETYDHAQSGEILPTNLREFVAINLLYEHGGVAIDVGVLPLQPLDWLFQKFDKDLIKKSSATREAGDSKVDSKVSSTTREAGDSKVSSTTREAGDSKVSSTTREAGDSKVDSKVSSTTRGAARSTAR